MRRGLAALSLLLMLPAVLQAQEGRRCRFRVQFVGDSGHQVVATDGTKNYFAGGGVIITCDGTSVKMESDSVAAYAGKVVQFIGKVRYTDSTVTLTADNGTYFKDGERWEARGNVVTTNLRTGSTLKGPSLDYMRAVKGVRDTAEVYAVSRPTINYVTKDSAGAPQEPYVIVGDRVRMKGDEQLWAGGKVTVDRSDLATRSDSLALNTGKEGRGLLLGGSPTLRATGKDTLDLAGRRIDFTLAGRELTSITASDSAHAVTKDVDLTGDTISIALEQQKARLTQAWGKGTHPVALTSDYELRGDSLIISTPAEKLEQVRGIGSAWAGGKPDSVTKDRDWVSGDTVVVRFASDTGTRSRVAQLEAVGTGKSFYRSSEKGKEEGEGKVPVDSVRAVAVSDKPPKKPSLNYARADRIVIHMRPTGEEGVEKVDFFGNVDGIQLEPDSTAGKARPKAPRPSAAPSITRPTLPGFSGGLR